MPHYPGILRAHVACRRNFCGDSDRARRRLQRKTLHGKGIRLACDLKMATPLTERLFGLRLSEDITDCVEYVIERLRAASPDRLRPVIVGQVNDLVSDAQYLFETQNLHHLPVVSGVKVVGIVSSTDILRLYIDSPLIDPDEVLLEHIMTPNPELIYIDAPIKELVRRLAHSSFRCLPVLDTNDELWDIVTTRDLVRFLELVYC